jgi:hypothetical protein
VFTPPPAAREPGARPELHLTELTKLEDLEMNKLNRELRRWENIYNTVRRHQSLGYLTPQQFLLQSAPQRKE